MSTTDASFRFTLLAVALLVLCGPSRAAADPPLALPAVAALRMDEGLRSSVEQMLRASPTFRAQYHRLLSAPALIVGVRVDFGLVDCSYRAMSTIRRFSSGLVVAAVVVGPGSGQEGWIAHEFEHVLEQLDGWDLRALAERSASGVYYSAPAMIETSRAIDAGRTISAEIRGFRRRGDNIVE